MDNPFADLIPSGGGGNPFADLIPTRDANFAERFEGAPKTRITVRPAMSDAVTDVPREIGNAASENLAAIKKGLLPSGQGEQGQFERLMNTGKAVAAIPGLIMSPITGAARSLVGHPMAQAEHAVGTLINPEVAAQDDPQKMYEAAKGDVDTAMSAARPAAAKFQAPKAAQLKASATAVYDSPAIKNINIQPADATALATKIENDLTQQGFRPTPGNAPATLSEVKNLYPQPGVQSVKVDDLRSARRALSIAAGQRDPLTGAASPDANAATKAIGHIDSFLDKLAPQLKTANADYAAAKSADRLDYRMSKAEHRAARSGTGGNLENVMRQEADKIPNRGLTVEEQAIRDQIVMGSPVRNALRTAGKLGVDGGLSLMLHSGAALGTGGTTIPVTVAGTIARKLGERLTKRQMEALSEQIRSRSPLASSLQKLQQGATAFSGAPSAKTYAAVLLAARNFSTNLRGAGVNLAPGELIKGLQSPAPANADDEQNVPRPSSQQ